MHFETLLWDMDGTLFDTYPPIRQAVIAAFAAHNIQVDPVRVAQLLADTFDTCVETLAAEHHVNPQTIISTYYEYNILIRPETQPPFPGVTELCLQVNRAGGRNLIFTHRERVSLDQFLALYGMEGLFLDTLTADEGIPRKPDPTGYLTLLERNQIDPAGVLVIGDRDLDILAGVNAGLKTCFFANAEFPGGVPLPATQPDHMIHTYAELGPLLFE